MTKIIFLIITCLILGIASPIYHNVELKNYQCSKCATLVKSERTPSTPTAELVALIGGKTWERSAKKITTARNVELCWRANVLHPLLGVLPKVHTSGIIWVTWVILHINVDTIP